MDPATIDNWQGFFTAQLGAAAALGGLVFVGLSLNLPKILSFPTLPNRALLAVGVLIGVLVASSFVLIPGESIGVLGIELFATGLLLTAAGAAIEVHTLRNLAGQDRGGFVGNMIFLGVAVVPYMVGGAVMIGGSPSGLYWVAASVIVSFLKAVADAWVLLVEINR